MASVSDDIDACVGFLEECTQCIAGCECWMARDGKAWDDEPNVLGACERLGAERAANALAAIERVVGLDDADAARWAPALAERLHGASAPPRVPYDPRSFFARAHDTLRARARG